MTSRLRTVTRTETRHDLHRTGMSKSTHSLPSSSYSYGYGYGHDTLPDWHLLYNVCCVERVKHTC